MRVTMATLTQSSREEGQRSCLPSYIPYRKGMGVTMATLTHSSREEGQRSCLPSYIPLEKGFVEEEG